MVSDSAQLDESPTMTAARVLTLPIAPFQISAPAIEGVIVQAAFPAERPDRHAAALPLDHQPSPVTLTLGIAS